jgi:hypothetical protein
MAAVFVKELLCGLLMAVYAAVPAALELQRQTATDGSCHAINLGVGFEHPL